MNTVRSDSITDFSGLRKRTRIVLERLEVRSVAELTNLTRTQIQESPNAGEHTLPDIEAFLAKQGKTLRQ